MTVHCSLLSWSTSTSPSRGAQVVVYRPGLILGHSRTGRLPTDRYWVPLLLRACTRLGLFQQVATIMEK